MQLVVALFVDSWRQQTAANFVEFDVCLRGEDNSQWTISHRYSDFYQFHHQVCIDENISKFFLKSW
jgi:hypothetical protein